MSCLCVGRVRHFPVGRWTACLSSQCVIYWSNASLNDTNKYSPVKCYSMRSSAVFPCPYVTTAKKRAKNQNPEDRPRTCNPATLEDITPPCSPFWLEAFRVLPASSPSQAPHSGGPIFTASSLAPRVKKEMVIFPKLWPHCLRSWQNDQMSQLGMSDQSLVPSENTLLSQ